MASWLGDWGEIFFDECESWFLRRWLEWRLAHMYSCNRKHVDSGWVKVCVVDIRGTILPCQKD